MAEIERVIEFLEDDKSYLFKMAENPNYTNTDRRKADDLYCDIKEAIQTIRELREDCNRYHEWGMHEGYEDAIAKLTSTSSLFNQGYICGVHDTEMKAKKQESEEVCEWINTECLFDYDDGLYKPSCNDDEDDFRDWNWIRHFKYCPYCGRKIKVVE